jgi:hypothetical protein
LRTPARKCCRAVVQIQRLLPAEDRPVVLAALEEAASDVVVAVRAVLAVQPGEIKHLLGLVVVAQLAVGDDPVAVGRLERRVDLFDPGKRRQGLVVLADAVLVHAQVVHRLQVVGVDLERAVVGVDRLFEPFHLVQGQSGVEEPPPVVRVDGCGGLQLFERFLPAVLLEKLLRFLDPRLGIVPVVHGDCAFWKNSCVSGRPAVRPSSKMYRSVRYYSKSERLLGEGACTQARNPKPEARREIANQNDEAQRVRILR